MVPLGRFLIVLGIVLLLLGLFFSYPQISSFLHLGRLPGDIRIKRGSFAFYLPLTTCLVLSILFSLIYYIFRK
jgi:hypothetical protein